MNKISYVGKDVKPEAATGGVLLKKIFLKISQISQKKNLCYSLYLIKLQALRHETLLNRNSNTCVFL